MTAIAAGEKHTCAITESGGVKCWGFNFYGALGNGTTTERSVPVDVVGLSSGATAIVGGSAHTCAVVSGGGVKCWGDNYLGQLGDGTTTGRLVPTSVLGLDEAAASLAAGEFHTCAVTVSGGMRCWGMNYAGQLGDGTQVDHLTPAAVAGLPEAASVSAARSYTTCAVTTTGKVLCWGYGRDGQLGDGIPLTRQNPTAVIAVSGMLPKPALGGSHACVITAGGAVSCWGNNEDGQLGDGTFASRGTPLPVSSLSGVTALAAGGSFTCAVISGGVKCWGDAKTAPEDVPGWAGVVSLAAGRLHVCALTTDGAVSCRGNNYSGQLGDGTTTSSATPVQVVGLTSDVVAIAAGEYHTCAVMANGGLKCWGANYSGSLGDGTTNSAAHRWMSLGFRDP